MSFPKYLIYVHILLIYCFEIDNQPFKISTLTDMNIFKIGKPAHPLITMVLEIPIGKFTKQKILNRKFAYNCASHRQRESNHFVVNLIIFFMSEASTGTLICKIMQRLFL